MEIKTCKNGHAYNAALRDCPECAAAKGNMPFDFPDAFDFGKDFATGNNVGIFGDSTAPVQPAASGGTTPVNYPKWENGASEFHPSPSARPDDAYWANQNNYRQAGTIPAYEDGTVTKALEINRGIPLVTGWLVCVEGPEKGKDFRLHSDYNYIGRNSHMDVCINDDAVSRENHAIIAHDTRSGVFFFAPASGRTMVRHNGNIVMSTVELKRGDRLEIGRGIFLFVPLCGEDFSW